MAVHAILTEKYPSGRTIPRIMDNGERGRNTGGTAVAAALVTGTVSLIFCFIASTSGRLEAAALALIAAAVAYVGVANAIFRQ